MKYYKTLKTKTIRHSGRSSDYIFPTLVQGCYGGCKYCYVARHSRDFRNNVFISNNIDSIIELVRNFNPNIIKPNQTHNNYITWDIGCNSDMSRDINYINWIKVFDYFKYSDRDFATFATKFVNNKLLDYDANNKIRVRLSLMPKVISSVVEPNTSKVKSRINFINKLYRSNYEVHLNFSPVIYYKYWIRDYIELFNIIDKSITNKVKEQLECEVIFLIHNAKLHNDNIEDGFKYEQLLWNPSIQENKISSFGGVNVRYKYILKYELIQEFKYILNKHLPYCNIRYIF